MKLKKLLVFPIIFPVLLSGCGNELIVTSQAEQVEISLSWWGNDPRHEYTLKAVEEFEKLHPDIHVTCSYGEWSGYQARNTVRMVSDTEADVMQINYAWIQEYSPDGEQFYDINKLAEYVDLSNFSQEALNSGMQNGKLNALPIALNAMTVYINKTVYDKYGLDVPETWDDLFNSARKMNGEVFPISMTSKAAWFYIVAYAEQITGKKFMNYDGSINFDENDVSLMLDFYKKLINEKVMPQVEYFERLNMDTGEYAGCVTWLSDASSYCDNAVKNGFEIVIADYTAGNEDNIGSGWYTKPATMFAVSKNTEYPKESAMLLDFLLNSDENAELQRIEKGIPISDSARKYLENNNLLVGLQYDAFLKMSEYESELSVLSPYFENSDMIDAFIEACNMVLYERSSTSDASKKFLEDCKEILL